VTLPIPIPGEGRSFQGIEAWAVRPSLRALLLIVVLTFDVSMAEFVEIQSLSDDERRARFALPATCTPRIAASALTLRPARLSVFVECAGSAIPATAAHRWVPQSRGVSFDEDEGSE
jgi:hypothetical protein